MASRSSCPASIQWWTPSRNSAARKCLDFVQVLEKPDLKDPGIVVQLNLRIGEVGKQRIEAPDRFMLTLYPLDKNFKRWDFKLESFKEHKDSCVVMYWDPRDLKPGETREVGFAYGLGNVSASEAGKLAVTVGGSFRVKGSEIDGGRPRHRSQRQDRHAGLALRLAAYRQAGSGDASRRAAPHDRPSPVTWEVEAVSQGDHDIVVSTDANSGRNAASNT